MLTFQAETDTLDFRRWSVSDVSMFDPPDTRVMLGAVSDLLGTLDHRERDARLRFQTKIAQNLLRIAGTEFEMEAAQDRAERARLSEFLGEDGALSSKTLNATLADRIRSGAISWEAAAPVIKAGLRERIEVLNPRFDFSEVIE